MSVAQDRPTSSDTLRGLYAPVRQELDAVEELLRKELCSDHPFVDRLAKHGFRLGGKRLRPALVLLSAQACGRIVPDHHTLSAVVEMVHTATLIHDDVLDEATLRRHLETINARWDNEASVLLGDYLFTRAICMASSARGTFACQTIGRAGQVMCEGELRQVANRGNYELSEEDYFDIISGKTAALIACCCSLGAHYADADAARQEALTRFGHQLGVAFQIVDDLLDVLGDENTAGKSLGTDLQKQKPTLPLIRLLTQANPQERAKVLALLTASGNHRREALRPWFDRFDTIGYARAKAMSYAQQAREELAILPASAARDSLAGLTEFVVSRQH